MATVLFEIPILEEIYDLDTISLQEISEKISQKISEIDTNSDNALGVWRKKAQKFLDLAVLEIKERQVIENFGEFCSKQMETLALDSKKTTPKKEEILRKKSFHERSHNDNDNINSTIHKNTNNFNEDVSLPSISLSKQSVNHTTNAKKQQQISLFNFMKETLAATKIQENRLVIGRSAVGKYKYVPPKKKKKKENKLKRSKTQDYSDINGLKFNLKPKTPIVLPKIEQKSDKKLKKEENFNKKTSKIEENSSVLNNKGKEIQQVDFQTKKEENGVHATDKFLSNFEENHSNETNSISKQDVHLKIDDKIEEKNNNNSINSGNTQIIQQKYEPVLHLQEEFEQKDEHSITEKIDFQAKYKDFIEKAKTFRPSSLYNINESEESGEESLLEKEKAEELSSKIESNLREDNKIKDEPLNFEKKLTDFNKINEETNNNLTTPRINTHYFSLKDQKEKENNLILPDIKEDSLKEDKKNSYTEEKIEKNSQNEIKTNDNNKNASEKIKIKQNEAEKIEINQKPKEKSKKENPLEDSKKKLEQTLSKYQKAVSKPTDNKIKQNKTAKKPPTSETNEENTIKSTPKEPVPKEPKLPKPPSKAKLPQHSLGYELDDSKIIDYSSTFPCFGAIFSGFYNNSTTPQNFDYIETMKEIYNLFLQHVSKVEDVDRMLSKHRLGLAPLELNPNDVFLLNEPKNLTYYAYKTNIDVKNFISRQQIFERKMKGELQNEAIEKTLYYRVVKNREEVYDIVTKSFFGKLNWAELPHGINLKTSWNLLWTWSKPQIDFNKLLFWQKVNHFPMNKNIVRKDLLKKNIEKMQKLGNKAQAIYNFTPQTYVLPKEYCQFMEHFYRDMLLEGKENIWIMKPIGKSRGRGISLVNEIGNVVYAEQVIVQKYLKNPLLLRGFKFDLRIYVLVTSIQPLEVFIYKEGFARVSTEPFSLDPEDLNKLFIHLTNVAIQKNNVDFHKDYDSIFGGSKISLKNLKGKLEERGYNFHKIWVQICEIVVKSLLACQQEIPQNPNCFELFGYDIIVDENLKCWLLEVNSSPSLSRETLLDDLVKQQLIDDIIELVDPILFDRKKLLNVLERRIKEEHGLKSTINTQNNSKQQMNKDLTYILDGKSMRKVGEMPKNMGNFERLAPSEFCDKVIKIIQQYKVIGTKNYTFVE